MYQLKGLRDLIADEIEPRAGALNVLATISHELRTPMNVIIGLSSLIAEESDPDKVTKYAQKITRTSEALLYALNTAIDAARANNNGLLLTTSEFELHALAEKAVELFSPSAEEKGLILWLTVDPHLIKKRFIGDSSRILQLLSGLLSNAVKFTQSGRVNVSLTHVNSGLGSSEVLIEVEDTGPGISDKQKEIIFEQFVQIHDVINGRPSGNGLGLFLCRKLSQIMGGDLRVASSPAGSRFSLSLNLVELPSESSRVSSPALNVAVVAPVSAAAELICEQLAIMGTNLEYHQRLPERFEEKNIDLILVDRALTGDASYAARHDSLKQCGRVVLLGAPSAIDSPANTEFEYWAEPYFPSRLVELVEHGSDQRTGVNPESVIPTSQQPLRHKILCVDDSPTNLIVLVGALTRLGYSQVLMAKNGREAVDVVERDDEVGFVFMDFNMPIMDGPTAADVIRKLGYRDLPIVGLTALEADEINDAQASGNFNDIIRKPASNDILRQILQRHGSHQVVEN